MLICQKTANNRIISHNDVHIRLWTNPQRTC